MKLSDADMLVPDMMIRPGTWIDGCYCDDMIAAFEVLSPSSVERDLVGKRQAYATLPSLQHYVVLSQTADVRCFDRSTGWKERRAIALAGRLDIEHPPVAIELGRLCRDISLA